MQIDWTIFVCAIPVPIICKSFFLNDFNGLRIFLRWSVFGTGHAIHITEHDENLPFTGGIGIGRPDIIPRRFNEAQIDIRFHTPRNLWKRLAARRYETSKITNRIDADNEKFMVIVNLPKIGGKTMKRNENFMIHEDKIYDIREIFPNFEDFSDTQKDIIGFGIWCCFRNAKRIQNDWIELIQSAKGNKNIEIK